MVKVFRSSTNWVIVISGVDSILLTRVPIKVFVPLSSRQMSQFCSSGRGMVMLVSVKAFMVLWVAS